MKAFALAVASTVVSSVFAANHGIQAPAQHRTFAQRSAAPSTNSTLTSRHLEDASAISNGTEAATFDVHKRFTNAKVTFYDAGLGFCGDTDHNGDHVVALNIPQMGTKWPAPLCGRKISISYKGKTTTATVKDRCGRCPWGGLDFDRGLFRFFAPESDGVISVTWNWIGGGGDDDDPTSTNTPKPPKTTTKPKPTSTHTTSKSTSTHTSTKSDDDDNTSTNNFAPTKPTSTSAHSTSTPTPSSTAPVVANLLGLQQAVVNMALLSSAGSQHAQ